VSRARVAAALGLAVAGLVALSCGEDPPPVCPTGNCNLPGSTIVKWRFNHYPERGFESDTCSDVGAVNVRVDITQVEDPLITDTLEKGCGEGQLTFVDLAPGTYTVSLTPLAGDGSPLVATPVMGQVLAGSSNANTEVRIDVPYTAWTRAYTGQFLFRLSWGGVSCAMAIPAVAQQRLTLTAGGQVVTQLTDTGQKLDGTTTGPCRALTEQFPQFVQGVTFGPATLHVIGTASDNAVLFDHEFDTFVGAAPNNPTLTFDLPLADAGVDAPIDAP